MSIAAFLAAAAVVVTAGSAMARWADDIAARTGWGRLWIGAIVLATATSLPELITDVSAVRIDAPNLAVGDLFGSSMANMAILAGVTLIFLKRHGRVGAVLGHWTLAGLAMALTGLAMMFVLAEEDLALGAIGVGTPLIAMGYLLAMWQLNRPAVLREFVAVMEEESEAMVGATTLSLRSAIGRFAAAAVVIAVAGPALAVSGESVADDLGVADTFFGAVGLAISTSLPELSVSLVAIRLGAADLAYGNLFGSNAANMAMLVILDAVYTKGSLLASVDDAQALIAASAVALTAMGAMLVLLQTRRQRAPAVTLATALLLLYVGSLALAY